MTTPDWLSARNGSLTKGIKDWRFVVTLDGEPLWQLDAVPARGKYTCIVMQTNNGRRLDGGKEYPTKEAAWAGGLEELRARLGW